MYILFVNELPEVIVGHCEDCISSTYTTNNEQCSFNLRCDQCGSMCCYVDDSTFTISDSNPADLTDKLSEKYKVLAQFFADNRVVLNDEKTHLIAMCSRKKSMLRENVSLDTGSNIVKPTESEQLLGIRIHQSLKWTDYVCGGKGSLMSNLYSRLNALRKVSANASFKT